MEVHQAAERGAWALPGAYRVDDGVHRIPLPLPSDGLQAVNVYALEDGDGLTLIDGGWAIEGASRQLAESLEQIGFRLNDIKRFLVTHAHRDHYTMAVALRSEIGARVSVGWGDRGNIASIRDSPLRGQSQLADLLTAGADQSLVTMWETWGRSQTSEAHLWADPDEWFYQDHTIAVADRALDAISTPGHTQGHFVFADRRHGLMFAGDHVLPQITPSVGYEPIAAALPLGDYLQSLAKVRALPDLRLLPAHGPVAPSVHARIDELLAHHDERLELCAEAVAAGYHTAGEVAGQLGWTRRGRRFSDLDPHNAVLAILETAVHLDLLASQGRLIRSVEAGVAFFGVYVRT